MLLKILKEWSFLTKDTLQYDKEQAVLAAERQASLMKEMEAANEAAERLMMQNEEEYQREALKDVMAKEKAAWEEAEYRKRVAVVAHTAGQRRLERTQQEDRRKHKRSQAKKS